MTAAFSFSGTELVGLAAAESENPGKSLPSAIKQVFWRVTLFYVLSLTFVGLLIDHDDPRLLGNGSYIDVTASPFVIVAERAGVIGFAHFTNVVIMLSVVPSVSPVSTVAPAHSARSPNRVTPPASSATSTAPAVLSTPLCSSSCGLPWLS